MKHVSKIMEKPSFISRHDQVITDPFSSECMRFEVDPIEHYGKENIYRMLKEYISSHDEGQKKVAKYQIIEDLLEKSGEPLANILLFAQYGMEKMKERSNDNGFTDRDTQDIRVIDALKEAQKKLDNM